MEARAPAVVAVVVTTGAAPGLEATLSTLVGQDYSELSILVVANGGTNDLASRVAAVAPLAFVKILDENRGFAAACNEAALMVQGAAFLLFCHDDVLFFEGTVSRAVEAAFRTNAGIVSPKVVAYDDFFVLLHVGQVADRYGAVRDRIEIGEIDHGQQDLERDVFVAPGGVTLVRTDLFETLGGFDPLIPAMGEDLDLCWRAQVAGARIIVAPAAVVAHRQTLATGERPLSVVGTRRASRADLQRRHQLATVLTCWGPLMLLQVIPILLLLDAAELVLSLLGRDTDRAGAILGSWRWAVAHQRQLRHRRKELSRVRVLSDADVARLQVSGASRLKTFVVTLFQDGLDRARGILPESTTEDHLPPYATSGLVTSFSEDENFDEIAALEPDDTRRRWSRTLTSGTAQAVFIVLAAAVWFYGGRNLVATTLPNIGRLAPLDSWWGNWRHFFSSWSSSGVGTGTPAMPGYGVIGFAGTFVLGRMGVLPKVMLLFSVPFGSWGVWRLLRGVVSNRARLIGAVTYLALPVGVNLIEGGRIDVLTVSALLPFAVRRVFSLVNVPGFRTGELDETVPFGHRGWGASRAGQISILVLQVALMSALAPASLVVIVIIVLGASFGAALLGPDVRLDRPWGVLGNVVVGTAILLLPMTYDTLAAGRRALDVFGLAGGPWTALGFGQLLRGANGTFGYGWGGWLLPAIALVALLLARASRRAPVVIVFSILSATLLVATLVGRNWLGAFAPDVNVLLVLCGLATAILVAFAISAIENDLAGAAFGWRQVVAGVTVLAVVAAALPWMSESQSGRFNLAATGTPSILGTLATNQVGGYRILWLGEPNALPLEGWSIEPGLAAALTTDALPNGSTLFTPPDSGTSDVVLNAVRQAVTGQTVRLGQLMATAGVSTIVVMTAAAPNLSGFQQVSSDPPPAGVIGELSRQNDLVVAGRSPGAVVFTNSEFHGVISERAVPVPVWETNSDPSSVVGWSGVLNTTSDQGTVSAGSLVAALAPASAFELMVNGKDVARSTAFGWAAQFRTTHSGTATLVLHQLPLNAFIAAVSLLVWLCFLIGFGALESLENILRRRPRKIRLSTLPELDSSES